MRPFVPRFSSSLRMRDILVVLAVLVASGCSSESSSPAAPSTPSIALRSLTVVGGTSTVLVGRGSTMQLSAMARYSDGSSQDVTSRASWTSAHTTIATVSGGLVTSVDKGEVTITASFEDAQGSLAMMVDT